MSIVIYVDGSSSGRHPQYKHRQAALGWAVLAHFNDQTVEVTGHRRVPRAICGQHETFAFIEGMRFAQAQGYSFEEMSFYTDDERIALMGYFLHPENYAKSAMKESFLQSLRQVVEEAYDDSVWGDCLTCLSRARITKLKGHAFSVCLNRADYLAREAMYAQVAEDANTAEARPFLSFEPWLAQGFVFYDRKGEEWTWYPPFSGSPAQDMASA